MNKITPIKAPVTGIETDKVQVPDRFNRAKNDATATGKSFLQLYNDYAEQPKYDTETAQNIKDNTRASVIADILKLVGEGVTTSIGGTPINRQSATPVLNAELQKLNELYKQQIAGYKRGALQASMMDEQNKRQQDAVKEAREAAMRNLIAKQAMNDANKQEERSYQEKKQKTQNEFTASQNKLNREATIKSASMRNNEKTTSIIDQDMRLAKIPKNVIEAWTDKIPKMVMSDPNISDEDKKIIKVYPEKAFNLYWDNYLEVKNGSLVPKETKTKEVEIPEQNYLLINPGTKKIAGF